MMNLARMLKDQIKYELFGKRSKTKINTIKKEGLSRKLSKRIKFTMKDWIWDLVLGLAFMATYLGGFAAILYICYLYLFGLL